MQQFRNPVRAGRGAISVPRNFHGKMLGNGPAGSPRSVGSASVHVTRGVIIEEPSGEVFDDDDGAGAGAGAGDDADVHTVARVQQAGMDDGEGGLLLCSCASAVRKASTDTMCGVGIAPARQHTRSLSVVLKSPEARACIEELVSHGMERADAAKEYMRVTLQHHSTELIHSRNRASDLLIAQSTMAATAQIAQQQMAEQARLAEEEREKVRCRG